MHFKTASLTSWHSVQYLGEQLSYVYVCVCGTCPACAAMELFHLCTFLPSGWDNDSLALLKFSLHSLLLSGCLRRILILPCWHHAVTYFVLNKTFNPDKNAIIVDLKFGLEVLAYPLTSGYLTCYSQSFSCIGTCITRTIGWSNNSLCPYRGSR